VPIYDPVRFTIRSALRSDQLINPETNLSPNQPISIRQSPIGNLVECVPNFSEGRNKETITRLCAAIAEVPTACVLDTHIDPDHNRSVITFVAHPDQIVTAAVNAVSLAAELIDMRRHRGEHPRLGATDVLPFVPVSGVTLDDCVALAHQAGARIARELSIPVFFYERAALRSDRTNLEDVRRGALELLREQIATVAERAPDVGPLQVHETAGALAVGARPFLIAFNINLLSRDVAVARQIARAVRARQGGLPFVKALGFELASRGLVQVSMNLVNYEVTGMEQAYAAVRKEADRLGVEIASTEIVGLVPERALDRDAEYFSKLENFGSGKVLESKIAAECERGKGE
jgi:glutamate formiminotransferase/glutamate formiminotransferase/formiminotetrahydrofolate cyclodeaminase